MSPVIGGVFPSARAQFSGVFQESLLLNIFVVPVILTDGIGQQVGPDPTLLSSAGDMVKNVYPIDEENVNVKVLDSYLAGSGDTFQRLDAVLLSRRFSSIPILGDKVMHDLLMKAGIERTYVLAVVHNVLGGNTAPLGLAGPPFPPGTCTLGFTYEPNSSEKLNNVPKMVVSLDRLPAGDSTIQRGNSIILRSTAAHEIGHRLDLWEEYAPAPPSPITPPPNQPHGDTIDAFGTAAGNYIRDTDVAFDVNGLRSRLAADDGLGEAPGSGPAVFVVDQQSSPAQMVPDPVAEGPIYGYMGGTGRGGIAGPLGQTLEGGGDVRVWTTTQCYKYLYPKLTTPYRASPSPKIAKNAEPRNVILVSGHVNQAGGGTLDYFCLGKTDLLFQRPTGSQYTVRFLSASGQVLDEFSFDAQFQMDLIFDVSGRSKPASSGRIKPTHFEVR